MSFWQRRMQAGLVATLLLVAACVENGQHSTDETSAPSSVAQTTRSTSTADETAAATATATLNHVALPVRPGPRRETTYGVPHIQLDAEPVPEVDEALRRRVFSLPGVDDRESELSLPGTRSLWLTDDIDLARSDVLLSRREFGHIHPDGSLHLWLPVDRAFEVAETKWGELHPWVGREDFWDGMVMIYTPETLDEVDVTMQLIVDAYNFVTGASLDPADFN